jgi:hypothetical protein
MSSLLKLYPFLSSFRVFFGPQNVRTFGYKQKSYSYRGKAALATESMEHNKSIGGPFYTCANGSDH